MKKLYIICFAFIFCIGARAQSYIEMEHYGIKDRTGINLVILKDKSAFFNPHPQFVPDKLEVVSPGEFEGVLNFLRQTFNKNFVDTVDFQEDIGDAGVLFSFHRYKNFTDQYFVGYKLATLYEQKFKTWLKSNFPQSKITDDLEDVFEN